MHFNYNGLCPELQLLILSYSDAETLSTCLGVDRYLRDLSIYVINKKISQYTGVSTRPVEIRQNEVIAKSNVSLKSIDLMKQKDLSKKIHYVEDEQTYTQDRPLFIESKNNLEISLYSPNNAHNKINYYETSHLSNISKDASPGTEINGQSDQTSSSASPLSCSSDDKEHLVSTSNLDKLNDKLNDIDNKYRNYSTKQNLHQDSTISIFQLESEKTSDIRNDIELLVDEDSSFTRFNFNIILNIDNKKVKVISKQEKFYIDWAETRENSVPKSQFLVSNNQLGINFKFLKKDLVNSNGLYDFNEVWKYNISFESFLLNNCYLLHCIEKALKD